MPRFNLIDLHKYHHMFTYPPSHVQRTTVLPLPYLQFPVQDISQLHCGRMEQALLASANVVQYGNQNTIVFVLPPALPEIRDFLMNGGGLITSSKRWYEAEFCLQFKQSCLRVWGVLQSLFTTWIIRCIGSLTLAKPHALLHNSHDNHTSFQLLHVERLEHDGSLVSASSVSLRLGVVCQDAQAIVLPHPRKCD